VLFDPSTHAPNNPAIAVELLGAYPSIAFLAYVVCTPGNFALVAKLSRHGLAGVILHPADKSSLSIAVNKAAGSALIRESLGSFEASWGKLPPAISRAIVDLFERPHRYSFATDIALEAGTTTVRVRREMKSAVAGSPQKLIILAKLLRGHDYLASSKLSVEAVCRKLGGWDRRVFAAHCRAVFGCSPSQLRHFTDKGEIVTALLEWFYKRSRQESPLSHQVGPLRRRLSRRVDSGPL